MVIQKAMTQGRNICLEMTNVGTSFFPLPGVQQTLHRMS